MTVVVAALAGVCAVLAAWEAIGLLQASGAAGAVSRAVAPLGAATGRPDVSGPERRRLVALLALTLGAGGTLVAGPLAGLALATAGPWLAGRALAARQARWRRALAHGAPVAARSLADALAGGHSVRGAVADAAAAGGGGPVTDAALRRAAAALAVGATTEDVLEQLRRDAAGREWDTLVAAILMQREAGGDLAGLLRELAGELEAARRVEADAHAASAQARFTARTVAGLPVLAAIVGELAAPGTLATMLGHPLSAALLIGAVGFELAGALAVRRLARLERR